MTTEGGVATVEEAFPPYDLRRARSRLVASMFLGLLTVALLDRFSWAVRAVAAWNAVGVTQLALAWRIIWVADHAETRRRAGAEDPGRTFVGIVVVLSSVVSLFAATFLLHKARTLAPEESSALAVLCLTAVGISWLLTHTTYTLRYARLFYSASCDAGGVASGLEFPGDEQPDDWDFAYFAFTIGMCFQVSDVTISAREIRRTALVHALISFAYNTAIVALALNLIFGLFG